MIRAGAGLSENSDSGKAAREAIGEAMAGMEKASLLLLFLTSDHLSHWPEINRIALESSGGAQIVGCSGFGVITGRGEIEGRPGISALALGGDDLYAAPFLAEGLSHDPAECGRAAGRQARQRLGEALENNGPPLVVILPDTYHFQAKEFFEGIHEELGAEAIIVGGGAAENGRLGRTFQFLGEQLKDDAVAGVVFAGRGRRFIGITQAYQPEGDPFVITKAEENIIFEISGRPAFEVFSEIAGPDLMENVRTAVSHIFIGIPGDPDHVRLDHGEYIVRPIVGIDPEKGLIALPEMVSVGQAITFTRRDGGRAREDLETMLSKAVTHFGGGSLSSEGAFGLYFNCAGRGTSLYGNEGVDVAAIRKKVSNLPLAGFFTGAEIAPIGLEDHLHQYSGVLMILKEEIRT